MPGPLVVRLKLDDEDANAKARESLEGLFGSKVKVIESESGGAHVRIVPLPSVTSGHRPPRGEAVVAVADDELAAIVPHMAKRSWLNHVVTPSLFDEDKWGLTLPGALWEIMSTDRHRLSVAPFLGKEFKGRQATIRDSDKKDWRADAIAEYASEQGASASTVSRIRDVAEELITNALYDAPSERNGVKADRTARVQMQKQDACLLTYGAARNMFFLRVRDQCGSLRRRRMMNVLSRCAASADVDIDSTSGGAGLGMWRIFNQSALVVLRVQPKESTDFLVGIDMQRGRRNTRGRAIHLLFGVDDDSKEYDVFEVKA